MFNSSLFETGRCVELVNVIGSSENFNEIVLEIKNYIEKNFEVDGLYDELMDFCNDEELFENFFVSEKGVKCWDIGSDCVSFIIMENDIPTVDNVM